MRPRRILVLGAGWEQVPLIREARRQGHVIIAVDGDPAAPGASEAHRFHCISTRDTLAILELARRERVEAATYMATETPLPALCALAEAFGFPGPGRLSVEASLDKGRMRELFQAAGIPGPAFAKVASVEEGLEAAKRVGYPMVVKPADRGGQVGLARVASPAELAEALPVALGRAFGGTAILEAWMRGPEFNAVAVVLEGRIQAFILSDRLKPEEAFGVVQRHLYPPDLDAVQVEAARALCQRCAEAMEVRQGILFPQLILTERGFLPVEIGERIPGGVMAPLFREATGIDLVKLQLAFSLGDPPDLSASGVPSPAVTVQFVTAEPGALRPGDCVEVRGRETLHALGGIVEAAFFGPEMGPHPIRPLRTGGDRFFSILARGPDREEAMRRSEAALAHLDFLDAGGCSLKLERRTPKN